MNKKILTCLVCLFIFSGCSEGLNKSDVLTIDRLITKDTLFNYLTKSNQKFIVNQPHIQNKKRTAFIQYYKKDCKDCSDFSKLYEYYQTKAMNNSDSLYIKISVEGGLSGSGFFIKYKNKKFKVVPFTVNDQSGTRFSNCTLMHQNLVLNKETFRAGDSIYGKINF